MYLSSIATSGSGKSWELYYLGWNKQTHIEIGRADIERLYRFTDLVRDPVVRVRLTELLLSGEKSIVEIERQTKIRLALVTSASTITLSTDWRVSNGKKDWIMPAQDRKEFAMLVNHSIQTPIPEK
jgi:hypothetical protein